MGVHHFLTQLVLPETSVCLTDQQVGTASVLRPAKPQRSGLRGQRPDALRCRTSRGTGSRGGNY
jgi:hypothetical protein